MVEMSKPWMKFYPADWRADPRLRMCSLAARGLWIDLMSYMHEGRPYGYLTIDSVVPDVTNIAALVARPVSEVRKALIELEAKQVFSRAENGAIYSRRMVRDKAKAEADAANGKGGGNPNLRPEVNGGVNGGVNPPDKAQILEARNQKERTEANASGADAPPDPRTKLFRESLETLARMTGKTPDSCRSLVGKWLKSVDDEAIHVIAAIEDAERNRIADPVAWINRTLKPRGADAKTARNGLSQALEILGDDIRETERSEAWGTPPPRLLSNG